METKDGTTNYHVSFTGPMHITFKKTDSEHLCLVNGLHIDDTGRADFTGTCVTTDGGIKCLKLFRGVCGITKDPNNHPLEINFNEILSVVSHSGYILWENSQ